MKLTVVTVKQHKPKPKITIAIRKTQKICQKLQYWK